MPGSEQIGDVADLQRQIAWALDVAMEQPQGAVFMIPARLEPCDIPDRLRAWNHVDLFAPDGYARLVGALRKVERRGCG
ncbi:hypothetical protein [Frankia sp. Cr2]|uniref:hypothetical protein n=1 Tax=Frankia sp. Cr2 TaxID=3073932 RepID=UPI002AD56EB4|nr:hypothetical protein [Frankia sp. Cr2]